MERGFHMDTGRVAMIKGVYDLEILEFEIPQIQDDQILIRVEAAAICGSDQHTILHKPPYPTCVGHEFSGKIVQMGKKAEKEILCYNGTLKVGDRIAVYPWITCGHCEPCLTYNRGTCMVCDSSFIYGGAFSPMGKESEGYHSSNPMIYPHFKGGFGDYVVIFPGTYVWKMPEDMSAKKAVLLDPMAVAMRAIEMAQTQCGVKEECLTVTTHACVVGAGPIGMLAGICLKILGVESVTLVDMVEEKLNQAKKLGAADYIVNIKEHPDLTERTAYIRKLTHGGPELVIQCANTVQAFLDALHYVKYLGTVVELGNAADYGSRIECNPAAMICGKHLRVMGMSANQPSTYNKCFHILAHNREFDFEKIFTHECTLDTLLDTMKKMKDPDYTKAICYFNDKEDEV